MNPEQNSLKVTHYRSSDDTVEITYRKGIVLKTEVLKRDLVAYEGVRHHIEYYEKDLNKRYFYQVPDPVFMRHFSTIEMNPFRGLLFISIVAGLGAFSMLTLVCFVNGDKWSAFLFSALFTGIVGALFFRNGNR